MDLSATITLDSSGDIVIDDMQRIPLSSGLEKVQQDLHVLLRSAKGSLATDPEYGIDMDALRAANGDTLLVENVVRQTLDSYYQTDTVESVRAEMQGRVARITATIKLTTGEYATVEVVV